MYYKIGENYLVDLEEETIFVFGIEGNKEETLAPEFWRTLHVLCQALKMLTAKEVEDKIQELFKWKSGKLVSKLVSVLRKEIFDSELLPKNRRNGAKEAVYGFTNIKKLSKDQFVQERDNLQHKYGESTQLITTTERLEKRIKQGNKVENSTLSNRLKVDGKFERRLNSLYIREELENIIEENFKRRTIQGLIGAPGTGKSCLALQYAYRKHITREYSKVLLLDCETRSSFLQSINLSENKGMDLELIAPQSIIEQFDVHDKKVLVIFDNLGFDQLLINTREMDTFCNTVRNIIIKLDEIQDGNIHILYTSREKKDLDSMPVCVDKFTEKQAGEFLKKGVSFQTKSDDLKKIIKNFGTLPIVLGTVVALGRAKGSYNKIKNINTYNSTLEEKTLLVLLKELFEELELSENGKNYVQLLKIASLLSPQFDRELLCSVAVKMGYTKEIFENCLDEYNDKVSILVEEENNRLQIHREYQQTIFGMLKPGEANLILKYIRETLESMMKWYQIFDYHFLQQMATIDTHIQKLFGLGLYEDMGQLFLISAFYNGFYLDYESKIFKQYFEWFQNRDDDFISAISLGEKAVIGIGNKKEQDSVKKGLYYYKNLFENELESKERNMVLIFLCYSIAEAEKRGGFKSNAIKVAEQGIEYIKKEKCSIETKRNVERLLALLQIQTMIYILKSQTYRRDGDFKEAQKNCETAEKEIKNYGDFEWRINAKHEERMKYSLAGILNESAVCLVEGNSSLEDLDEAETRYKAAYNLYLKSAGKLKAENEVANLSECYRERAQYFNKEGSFSSFIESLHIARYYLELGYKMREDVSALDENYKSIYHRYLFQQNIAWMNLKNPEIILTMEFDKSKIDAYIKKEISSIEIDDKIKKESPIKTWIDEKNNPERTTKIFYEFLLSDSQEHLDNVVKYVLDGSLDTKRKIDELMNELMGRKINELMEAVEIKYNLVQLLRYYGIYYKKRLQYSVENEIDNKSENFRKAECLLKRSIECGKHMDDEKACKRACKLAYRELAVLYIMMSMKEEVKETLEEMAYIFTELDPKKGFGKWYVEKIREYKLPIEMKFS